VYPEAQTAEVMALLGRHAGLAGSYQAALEAARADSEADPGNSFAWHNLGTSLDYFETYEAASLAFDEARRIGLPWRMLWYQAGLYSAYYNSGRYRDVIDLASVTQESTLGVDLEESLYWRGLAKHALGDATGAQRDFERALAFNPNFEPARAALAQLGGT
jgi:lipoprotein NlpI